MDLYAFDGVMKKVRLWRELFFLFCLLSAWVYFHELTHRTIYWEYGCEDIKTSFDIKGWTTTASCPESSVKLAQAENEVVGYNVMPFLIIIALIMFTKAP
jgi:hypothetical protein